MFAVFAVSVLISLFLWVMAAPGSGDFEPWFKVVTWCFLSSHAVMAVIALRYLTNRHVTRAVFALMAAPVVGFASSLAVSGVLYGF